MRYNFLAAAAVSALAALSARQARAAMYTFVRGNDPLMQSACSVISATSGWGINNAGQTTGYYYNGTQNGYIDTNGTFVTIDEPNAGTGPNGTYARGINNSGEVVGFYFDKKAEGGSHGFIYLNGTWTDFTAPFGKGATKLSPTV